MNDYDYQLRFVTAAAWRLLEMQDRNPLSPSHGCFHYAYWRDKTSEFADARFQEAGATLGLLSLPRFDAVRARGALPPAETLYRAFSASLRAWERFQYPEGCWDEWYKGERGFAATEFTMIAFGLAVRHMGGRIAADDRARLDGCLLRAGRWLAARHDRVKANHEAAAGAALAIAWAATGEESFRAAAADKIADTLARQTAEGWFPEIGGMDLGYCSVLLDYVMLYVLVTGDDGPVPAMRRLMEFMTPHLHPDATISPEAGLCLNPYVSRLGSGLLSAHGDENAAAVVATLAAASPGARGLAPTLGDDLRLCRWSHLPVVTALERERFGGGGETLAARFPAGWTVRKDSAVAAWHGARLHVYFPVAGGGAVRVYDGADLVLEDAGVSVETGEASWCSAGYSAERPIAERDGGVAFAGGMGRAAFFYPGFLARLVLRLGSVTAPTSRWLRAAIDRQRLRKGTAVNQSAAPLATAGAEYAFERHVEASDDAVTIKDRVERANGEIDSAWLKSAVEVGGVRPELVTGAFRARRVEIVKRLEFGDGAPRFSARVDHG